MVYSIEEIQVRITPVAVKYQLCAVYLFGSYARGEATEDSDIDILIDRTGSLIKGLFDMGGLYNDLCDSLKKEVDIVTTYALIQDGEKDKTPWFSQNVMKERISIYEQQRFTAS